MKNVRAAMAAQIVAIASMPELASPIPSDWYDDAHAMLDCAGPKYVVQPGYVHSKHDGQRHWISAFELMELYNVAPANCIVVQEGRSTHRHVGLKLLRPRYDGKYILENCRVL